jgi:hypothetical protein
VLRRSTTLIAAIEKYEQLRRSGLDPLNLYGSKVDLGLAFASGVVDPEGFGEA